MAASSGDRFRDARRWSSFRRSAMTCSTTSVITAGRKRRAAESRRTANRRVSANKAFTSSGASPADIQHPNPERVRILLREAWVHAVYSVGELAQSGYINLKLWCRVSEPPLATGARVALPVPLVFNLRKRTFDFVPGYSQWSPLSANRVFCNHETSPLVRQSI
jgi:hypothetical protein